MQVVTFFHPARASSGAQRKQKVAELSAANPKLDDPSIAHLVSQGDHLSVSVCQPCAILCGCSFYM